MDTNEISPLIPSHQGQASDDIVLEEVRKSKIRFIVVAACAIVGLATSPNVFQALIFYPLASYISYRLFNNHVIKRFSNRTMSAEKALWFVSIGLERASLWRLLMTILYSILFSIIPFAYLYSRNPIWLQDITNALQKFADHGQIVDISSRISVPLIGFNRLCKSATAVHQFWKPKLLQVGTQMVSDSMRLSRSSLNAESEFEVQPILFEDGTDAGPIIGELLIALSRIPLSFLLFWAVWDAFIVKALPREGLKKYYTNKFAATPIRSSANTVVASAASIGLGMCIFDWVFLNAKTGGIISAADFWLDAAMQVFIGSLIGIALYRNSESLYIDEKKFVLLEPVLLRGTYNLFGKLVGIQFLKILCPIIGDILIQGSGNATDLRPAWKIAVLSFISIISSIGLVVFVTKKAINRFEGITQSN